MEPKLISMAFIKILHERERSGCLMVNAFQARYLLHIVKTSQGFDKGRHFELFEFFKFSLTRAGEFSQTFMLALTSIVCGLQKPMEFFEILKLLIRSIRKILEEDRENTNVVPLEYYKLVTLYYDVTQETDDLPTLTFSVDVQTDDSSSPDDDD
ncbi:MAG: hypothetical protein N0C90_25240 [Candidatus Thiodiazotropha endolucinida]|nr:hypothetical protein [Candidatus Thiodiazotropha taylori]MCG8046318.1 hypothetical protein [Candidatus Thiodiazotropha taylori]MCW4264657.1 hypothetical protein [Candidatus Thiodiazotropha endolucinida]MCW4344026.1 hypothetical protein [Candidatus Thiodiazotropha endolucinida]